MNIQGWFPLGLTGLISLQSKQLSKVFFNTDSSKASILQCSAFFMIQLSHLYMTTRKTIALTTLTFASKVIFLHTLKCENHCLRGFLYSNKFEKQILYWKESEDLIWGQALALPLNNPELLLWDAWEYSTTCEFCSTEQIITWPVISIKAEEFPEVLIWRKGREKAS